MRDQRIPVELSFKGKPGQRMKRADRLGARFALSLGDEELAKGVVKLRDLDSGVEEEVGRGDLVDPDDVGSAEAAVHGGLHDASSTRANCELVTMCSLGVWRSDGDARWAEG